MGVRARVREAAPADAPGATEPELVELTGAAKSKVAVAVRQLVDENLLARSGGGKKGDPYRYQKAHPTIPNPPGGEQQLLNTPLSPLVRKEYLESSQALPAPQGVRNNQQGQASLLLPAPGSTLTSEGQCTPLLRLAEGAVMSLVRALAYSRRDAAKAMGVSLTFFEERIQPDLAVVRLGGKVLVPVVNSRAGLPIVPRRQYRG